MAKIPAEKLVFLDESGVNTNLVRRYGRAVGKTRVVDNAPFSTPTNTTILSAIRLDGQFACTEVVISHPGVPAPNPTATGTVEVAGQGHQAGIEVGLDIVTLIRRLRPLFAVERLYEGVDLFVQSREGHLELILRLLVTVHSVQKGVFVIAEIMDVATSL